MSKIDYIVLGLITTFFFAVKRKDPVASVDFETPTISGSGSEEFGGTDYATSDTVL